MEPNLKRVSRKPVPTQKSSSSLSGGSQSSDLMTVAGIEKKTLTKAASREYVYKIDCERVANHVNVDDLVRLTVCVYIQFNNNSFILAKASTERDESQRSKK